MKDLPSDAQHRQYGDSLLTNRWKRLTVALVILLALTGIGFAYAPVIYAEAEMVMVGMHLPITPPPLSADQPVAGAPAGTVIDGYWLVEQIAPDTYAIGEPLDSPDNYEYLLLGKSRALLIDAGATTRDIHPALAKLTALPVTVIPTHLHFDHTNGLRYFSSIAMIDLPETRTRIRDDLFHLQRYQYMDSAHEPPVFRVTEWLKPDATIDLGDRLVQILWTPGHTATSVSVYDARAKLIFTGDLIYPTTIYAFMEDSSLSAYEATTERLLAMLPEDTAVYGAHCCRSDAPPAAPKLGVQELRDLRTAVVEILGGHAQGHGAILRRFPVDSQMTLVTLYPFGNW